MWDFTGILPASLSVGEEECGEGGGEEADYEEEATFRNCAELSLLLPGSCSKPSAATQQALAEANCFSPPAPPHELLLANSGRCRRASPTRAV